MLLVAVVSGAWAQESATYKITLAEGTEDAGKWTISPNPAEAGSPVTATYNGEKKVKSVKAVKKGGAEPAGNTYLKWDANQKKLVATEIPAEVTTVTSSTVTWPAGTYVVEGEVEISSQITITGDVNLIIKDGAKLTVNHRISGGNKNLSIYGQANQTGQLVVNKSNDAAIKDITTLEVHSCKVKATGTSYGGTYYGGFKNIVTFNVYGGSVDAECTNEGYGILLANSGSMNIYGGDVKAVGKGTNTTSSCGITSGNSGANVKVYGGKLWAECATNKALNNINLTTEAGFTGKIEYSSDKSTWSKTADADAKYVRIDPDANAYLKWNEGQKKLVTTEIPEEVTMVQNANQDVTWAAGTYVVDGEVTINGKIFLDGNVDLIIKDDATLTVNKYINGSGLPSNYDLKIYGQANKSGQLVVTNNDGIFNKTTLEVHSCQVKATSSNSDSGGFSVIGTFNVYGRSVDAENTGSEGYGILLKNNIGSMNIYGGDVKVVGTGNHYRIAGSNATVTVYGGKLWAECAGYQALSDHTKLTKGDGFNGKIETSDDGNDWTEYKEATTPETKYVRAGY